MRHLLFLPVTFLFLIFLVNAQEQQIRNTTSDPDSKNIQGFGFLNKIAGLWHGPVSSTTSAGSFDNWYVDFRPVSAGQVSQYSLLDSNTVNNISFFIVKHDNRLKIAMRSEGCFKNQCCVTYEVMDSAVESAGYYRFSDFVNGVKRAYTEFQFKDDELIMKVYTNKFNKVNPLQLHSTWTATSGGRKYASEAASHFSYPKPVMIKDFSNVFRNMKESIFFTFEEDPYKSLNQPYQGNVTATISIDQKLRTDSTDEICILLTTEPLFEGIQYKKENLKYISKSVFLPIHTSTCKIKNIHPGKYYIYAYVDKNNDRKHASGDYMNSNVTNFFTVIENGNTTIHTVIDFVIP